MLEFCRKYVYKIPYLFCIYIATILLKTALSYVSIMLSGKLIDSFIDCLSLHMLERFCILIAVLGIVSIVLTIINGYIGSIMQTKLGYLCSKDLYQKITRLPYSYLKNQDMAYLSQRINADSNACLAFFMDTYVSLYVTAISMIVSFVMILRIEFRTAIVLIVLAMVYGFMYKVFRNPIYVSANRYKEASAHFFGKYYECMESVCFSKNHSVKNVFLEKMDKAFGGLFKDFIHYQKVQLSYVACDGFISTASSIFVYVICGIAILNGKVSIGLFTVVLNLFGNLAASVKFFLDYGKTYQETKVSYDRIEAINNLKEENCGNIVIDNCSYVKAENLSFGYNSKIIRNFSYDFHKGNVYYIVGQNGAGKTTLVNLILGNYQDSMDGNVLFNGNRICNVNMINARKNIIGYSEQDTFLVSGTVRENLELFCKNNDIMEKYVEELKLFSDKNGDGLSINSQINIQQNNLSGGEKQKISIIRQLIQNPDIMIFDEPTANLEPAIKRKFAEILQSIKKDKIIIVVTHDRDIISGEDIVVNL